MRAKLLAVAGVTALFLCGCAQQSPPTEPVVAGPAAGEGGIPAYPAHERFIGALKGSGSASIGSLVSEGTTVIVYLGCQSEGELELNVNNSAPTPVPCGTLDEPTRTVFTETSAKEEFSIDVVSEAGPVYGLAVTEEAK